MAVEASVWSELDDELRLWEDHGLSASLWLRDDDAITLTPALERLERLCRTFDIECGLAVIPGKLQADLTAHLVGGGSPFLAMCHGWVHANHGDKTRPAEFGPERPVDFVRKDAERARAAFKQNFGVERPYFVPPFGQISPGVAKELPAVGFGGLSNQNPRPLNKLVQFASKVKNLPRNPLPVASWSATLDAHVDPIDWGAATAKADQAIVTRLVGELRVRRLRYKPTAAPIGVLTHHLVHDEAIWSAVERLFERLKATSAVAFPRLADLTQRFGFKTAQRASIAAGVAL